MKVVTINAIIFISLLKSTYDGIARQNDTLFTRNIGSISFEITDTKTSNLIFAYPIVSVDRGSHAILVQKAKGTDNILQLKAETNDFQQTNLSVITKDGRLYSFIIDYNQDPKILNLALTPDTTNLVQPVQISGANLNDEAYKSIAKRIKKERPFMRTVIREQKIQLHLTGIYIADRSMWFTIQLTNKSQIDYKIDQVRFLVRDRRRTKRTAIQEQELVPQYTEGSETINGLSKGFKLFAFIPFTIPKTKEIIMVINETNGGRNLQFKISHYTLIKAKSIIRKQDSLTTY
ncbi:MAG: conjugative transposon protein TraN [Bacteroidota bacterium]